MARAGTLALALACALACAAGGAACTPAHAPAVRTTGKVMALGGVAGLVGTALATGVTDKAGEVMIGFEVISAVGVIAYAYAELTWPRVRYLEETLEVRHRRWAKILTERASGAARDGRCARVRRLERRVHRYDRVVHDFVFMKDPEILKCLATPPGAPPSEALPSAAPSDSPPSDSPPADSPPTEAAPAEAR
ncbi:MAG TPA: hypothetical protein VK932_26695 [Kofleriaceae bacterium]|nr:hypothetical protein [Kofleriaceae bacterium]